MRYLLFFLLAGCGTAKFRNECDARGGRVIYLHGHRYCQEHKDITGMHRIYFLSPMSDYDYPQ